MTDAALVTQRTRYALEADSKLAQHYSLLPTFLRRAGPAEEASARGGLAASFQGRPARPSPPSSQQAGHLHGRVHLAAADAVTTRERGNHR